ncbi:hypothetical protein BLNAU_3990 [Blattamonas nauphoetae]|uniref:Uncharacterized protein n=1 Tax=Blattamonas nauphoetae TaxID=2049346 RepID=A0ABQ9YAT8_9EUKA|nr:hypothetical protein BLNAU_3990 [Blattamonas nauphoetae]
MNTSLREFNNKGVDQRQMWQTVHRMLRMEGIEDVIETKLQHDKEGMWRRGRIPVRIVDSNPTDAHPAMSLASHFDSDASDSFSAAVCVHGRFCPLCVADRGCLLTLFTNCACPILAPSSSELHLNAFSSSPSNICRRVQSIHFRQSDTPARTTSSHALRPSLPPARSTQPTSALRCQLPHST